MKKLLIILSLFILNFAFSQIESSKQIFESPKMKEEISKHKIVAIIPFKATISFKRLPKNFDAEANKEEEKKMGLSLQSAMYTFLLRKSTDYTASVQEVDRTNVLLRKAEIFDKLDELTSDEIAKILGVDAVIKCSYAYEKTGSEAGAIAKTLLFGSLAGGVATGELTMQVYNGKDGELLWRFYKQMSENVFSSANEAVERMMRKVGRNFPYQN